MMGLGRPWADVRPSRNRLLGDAKRQDDQDQTRYTATGSAGDRSQSQAAPRGQHGHFTIQ